MGTKLKNIKYSMVVKVIAVVMALFCVFTAYGSSVYLLSNENIARSTNYYETYGFYSEYSRLIHNIIEYNVKLKSEENIKASGKTKEEIQNMLDRYNTIKNRITECINFTYYIKDRTTGAVITNNNTKDPISLFEGQDTMFHYSQDQFEYRYPFMYTDDIKLMLSGTSYEVYAAVMEPLKQGDVIYDNYVSYTKAKMLANNIKYLLIASLILFLMILAYLVFSAGRKEGVTEVVLTNIDRIYIDVHTIMVLVAAAISIFAVAGIVNTGNFTEIDLELIVLIILTIDFLIGLSFLLSVTRQLKAGGLMQNILIIIILGKLKAHFIRRINGGKSIVVKSFSKGKSFIKLCFNGKIFRVQILFLLLVYTLLNIVFSSIIFHYAYYANNGFYHGYIHIFLTFLLFAINGFVFYQTAKGLKTLSTIIEGTKNISSGNMDYAFDVNNMSVAFAAFAENIQTIQSGLKKAVDEAIKGERMKTDLITNVSHDLKTPLTSIINYVDLLKKEELDNQKVKEYINILDEKSARLKVLIEDLVEASKASSGNLPVNAEKVDLHELVMQAVGEYREKIEKAGLDIRTSTSDKNIFVRADGKHMWRIIENLLSNVLKYSMQNSRVYINITKNETHGVLTIKNISALPLEIPVEQLTERFVRGDVSRTTEGSGLGLSIAQSLTNIQKGRFNIEIDGDLFKVNVEIPLWNDL